MNKTVRISCRKKAEDVVKGMVLFAKLSPLFWEKLEDRIAKACRDSWMEGFEASRMTGGEIEWVGEPGEADEL
jgi:hypothetical protein